MRKVVMCSLASVLLLLHGCGSDKEPQRLSFRDIASDLPSIDVYGNYGALWGDFNNDQRMDLIYMGHGEGPFMLSQTAGHDFEDVTSTSGIKNSDWEYIQQRDRHGASCSDFNNDGKLDLFISHGAKEGQTLGTKNDELLKGNGDFSFTEITRAAGTMNHFGRGRSSLWFDYNKDGWVDLYVLNLDSKNVMYKNNGDGTFTDVTAQTGLGFAATHATAADFDQDGNIDLLVDWPLKLFRNTGAGRFEQLKKSEFAFSGLFAFGLAVGDADNDGDLDIFLSAADKNNMLLINDGGSFRSVESTAWEFDDGNISTGVSWGDMDNDGFLDIVNIRSDGYFTYLNDGDLSFSKIKLDAPAPAIKRARNGDAALADFNNDGLLDIATDDPNGYMLLENQSAPSNNWLKIGFDGTDNNRLGIGNKVWVTSKGKLIAYRDYTGTSGSLRSASCGPLHIGLAQNPEVDIRVRWLNGFESVLHHVRANQVLTISDSESAQ